MKELIPRDDWGVFASAKGTVLAYSVDVARVLGRRHDHAMETIQQIIEEATPCDEANTPESREIAALTAKAAEIEPANSDSLEFA